MTSLQDLARLLPLTAGILLCTPLAFADVIDFEGLPAGTILSSLTSVGGVGPILVNGHNPTLGQVNAAVIFDSAHPTGNDFDLGTPHADFNGPGQGSDGQQGAPNQNDTALGKILIVEENMNVGSDGLVIDPGDENVVGTLIEFDFSALGTVTLQALGYMDIESSQPLGSVEMFDAANNLLLSVPLAPIGDNAVAMLSLGDTAGVDHMRVTLDGSGAITGLEFHVDDPSTAELGDTVWNDLDGDGIQEVGEPGIEGVIVRLELGGTLLASMQTDVNGRYGFSSLLGGVYTVALDASTIPDGFVTSPCNVGGDDSIDSDCSPVVVTLAPGQHDDSVDFGLEPIPFVNCQSLPNSTGQAASAAGGGSTSISDNQFSISFNNLPPHQPAYLFYGTNDVNVPFGGGIRCIGSPLVRYQKVPDIATDGTALFPLNFAVPPMVAGFGEVVPGVPFYFQLWYRDPASGSPFNMSDSLCVTFAP